MGEYTAAALLAPVLVVALELRVLRTGILRTRRYWLTMAIVLAFQVPVDGALTYGPAPVVSYGEAAISGVRWPLHIPVEDFGFGFAMVTLTLALWQRRRAGVDGTRGTGGTRTAGPAATPPAAGTTAGRARRRGRGVG